MLHSPFVMVTYNYISVPVANRVSFSLSYSYTIALSGLFELYCTREVSV